MTKTRIWAALLSLLMVIGMAVPAMAATATGAPHVFLSEGDQVNAENDDQFLVWLGADRYQSLGGGAGTLDILEKVATDEGIELVFINKTADQKSFVNMKLMAGEIPDIFDGYGSFSDYNQLVQDGILAELPVEFIRENMPNYTAWVEYWGGANIWKYYERDGKNYALPNIWTLGNNGMGLGIREDLFVKAGASIPTTIDEWTEAMGLIKENLGIATLGGQKDLVKETTGFVYGAFGAYPGIFYEKDGDIIFGSIQPEIKEGLKVVADWYQKGYIDPEYTTIDGANMVAKWNDDRVAATVYYWWAFYPKGTLYGTDFYDVTDINEEAIVTHIDFPTGPDGLAGSIQGNSAYMGPMFGAHMTTDQIAKYMKIWDKYSFTSEGVNLLMAGIEGVHYTYDPVKGVIYNAPYDTEEGRYNVGLRIVDCIPITLNNYEVQAYTNFTPEYQPLRDAGNAKGIGQGDLMGPFNRPIWNEKSDMLNKLSNDFLYDVMVGNKSVDEFDKFVADWLAAGGQEVLDEANALWHAE